MADDFHDQRVHALIHRGQRTWQAPERRYVSQWLRRLKAQRDTLDREIARLRHDLIALLTDLDQSASNTDGHARLAIIEARLKTVSAEANQRMFPHDGVPCSEECPWRVTENVRVESAIV